MRIMSVLPASLALLVCFPALSARADDTAAEAARAARPHHIYLVGGLRVSRPYLGPGDAATGPVAAFATIENQSDVPDRLLGGSIDGAGPLVPTGPGGDLAVPPRGTLTLTPGDRHLTLQAGMPAGEVVTGTLRFQKAGVVHLGFAKTPAEASGEDQTAPLVTDKPVDLAQ